MEQTTNTKEDPLIAALPPATDYMTYLTLLEYQLNPDNLSTLNRLLSEDDGTLASEIGWDLLKLVLPMLQIVPEDANKCLGIIARRGNPREVVVRVAEELERLGESEEGVETDQDEEFEQDDLPTFAGEAPRIHLGEMKLEGMPPSKEQPTHLEPIEVAHSDRRSSLGGEYGSDAVLSLQALLSMLSILHPRIKTQYPSRFLATSLPAALSAYRRMRITTETTIAFIDFLAKMSGKQRPTLPPRKSTAGSIITIAVPSVPSIVPTTTPAAAVQAPPLPDPEAKTDPSSDNTGSTASEKAISNRLLQAVMLEVLDEYTASFQSTDQPSMSWTVRLREKHEPKRVLPGRPTETQRWTQSADLKSRDEVVAKFLKLGKDLNLDVNKEIDSIINPSSNDAETIEEPESDYPTSPSQIPFPTSGLILLFAAQNFAQDITGLTTTPSLNLTAIRKIFRKTYAPVQELPHPPSLSQTDALLSLIYTTIQSPLSQLPVQPSSTTSNSSDVVDLPFLTNLTNLFTTSPDQFVRDSTHHLTTILLHNHTTPEVKLLYIKSLLAPRLSPTSPVHEVQQGNINAIAINWLKDEFLAFSTPQSQSADPTASLIQPLIKPVPSAQNPGLDPNILHTDPDLPSLIFPALPALPGPFLTGGHPGAIPQPPSSTSTSASSHPSMNSEEDLETHLLQIPAYIASLNLLCILASIPSTHHDHESVLVASPNTESTSPMPQTTLLERTTQFLRGIETWKDIFVTFSANLAKQMRKEQGGGGVEVSGMGMADAFALEDAVGRARGAMEGLGE